MPTASPITPALPVTVTDVQRSWDGTFLLLAYCPDCHKTVMHGGGTDPDRLTDYLGDRVAHCDCSSYALRDPHGVISSRLAGGIPKARRA